jgi:GNAT superfamily N-acetyltransferase
MWWRVERGGREWERVKGERNRRAFRALIERGEAQGVLAFDGDEAVGWCAVGPRSEFPRTERVRALTSAWDAGTWSVNCFFVPARQRGRGVASKLLAAAVELARKRGARTLEGYPLRSPKRGEIAAAFAWTGVVPMFERAGFACTLRGDSPREVWSIDTARRRPAPRRTAKA